MTPISLGKERVSGVSKCWWV